MNDHTVGNVRRKLDEARNVSPTAATAFDQLTDAVIMHLAQVAADNDVIITVTITPHESHVDKDGE